MERSWYARAGLVLAVLLLSLYQLIPSWKYFSLSPEDRGGPKYEASVPKWAPKPDKRLNLGLDLMGGVLLSMGVDVDRAVKAKLSRRADEIGEFLKDKGIVIESAGLSPDGLRIQIKTSDAARVQKTVVDQYGSELTASAGAPAGTAWFEFRPGVIREFKKRAVDQAEKTIRNRVDKWGVTEPDIKRKGENQIQIQIPGFKDPDKAKDLLGRTAQLEFKIVADYLDVLLPIQKQLGQCKYGETGLVLPLPEEGCWSMEEIQPAARALPAGLEKSTAAPQGDSVLYLAANTREQLTRAIAKYAAPLIGDDLEIGIGEDTSGSGLARVSYYRTYLLRAKTELTGDYISDAYAAQDNSQGGGQRPLVIFSMSAQGGMLMEKLTSTNVHRRMATVLDGKVETAPYIQSTIRNNGQITLGSGGDFQRMWDEANNIALVLKAGALPAPVAIFQESTVGGTLGPELIRKGTAAALVGLALVMLFMLLYYRMSGFIADIALALNGLLLLAIMAAMGSTLTLPGIAGFVLTLGMAVDANVLINERIREELRAGKVVRQAIEQGYGRVFWTIVDSNVTTLAAAVMLMQYGTGPIRGFAVTLTIGLLASMFTSIVVTRVLVDLLTRRDTARLSV
jgi:preprotein translocase subunit SecD